MIVKMKFMSITGPKEDIDRIVNQYLSKYEIHLENAMEELKDVHELTPYLQVNPYKEALKTATDYRNLLPEDKRETDMEMELSEALPFLEKLDADMTQINEQRAGYETQKKKYRELYEKIEPFIGLQSNVSDIIHFKNIKYRFGRIPVEYFSKFKNYVYDKTSETIFYRSYANDEYVWGIYFCLDAYAAKVDAVYASMHFERIFLPDAYEGTPREAHEKLESQLADVEEKIADCDRRARAELTGVADKVAASYRTVAALSRNFDVRKLAATTDTKSDVFYILCGWMPERDAVSFQKEVDDDDKVFCFVEPDDENITSTPPTKLKNPKIFKPFEMFTKMYGLPAYHEFDPTIFISITYSLIFGAMFGDVGQGLCLVIGGALLYRFRKLALAAIIGMAGVCSTIFGFLYGSVFGFENIVPALWLRPKEAMMELPFIGRMNTVFIIAIVFGMFMILFTMILHIAIAVKSKDTENVLFDGNAISGFVFYGAIVAVMFLFMTGHHLPAVIVLVVMFVVPLLLIMLKEPLTRLVRKKKPAIEGSKPMFFVQSFFEVFEVVLSYMSNTLSFLRIGAYALSHAVMMEVVMMLAGAENGGSPNMLVVVLGNIFVLGVEGLMVAIQVLRLEYYEMFSRFYQGTGREFKPFLKSYKKG